MLKAIIPLFVLLFFSSCATILNQKTVDLTIQSENDTLQVCLKGDTTRWYKTPATIRVERSPSRLRMIARKDTIQKEFSVKSCMSDAYVVGNLFGAGLWGYLADLLNDKRYSYPSSIVDMDTAVSRKPIVKTTFVPRPGLVSIQFGLPAYGNAYLSSVDSWQNFNSVFPGINTGLEYYFSDENSIGLNTGFLTSTTSEIRIFPDIRQFYQTYSIYANLLLGADYRRFHYDFGMHVNHSRSWMAEYLPTNDFFSYNIRKEKIVNNFGVALSGYYRLYEGIGLGVDYFPSFASFNAEKIWMQYSHILMVNLNFNLELFRSSRLSVPLRYN